MVQERLKHQHWEYSTEIIKLLLVNLVIVSGLLSNSLIYRNTNY